MAGPPLRKPATHEAWAFRRLGRKPHQGYWVEIGSFRKNDDGTYDAFLDRTPIGGFGGHVAFRLIGSGPPSQPKASPHRPGQNNDEGEEGGEDEL